MNNVTPAEMLFLAYSSGNLALAYRLIQAHQITNETRRKVLTIAQKSTGLDIAEIVQDFRAEAEAELAKQSTDSHS